MQWLWYQAALATTASPAADLLRGLTDVLASRVCTGVILSFARPQYRAWERPLATDLIARLWQAQVPYYVEVWPWAETIQPDDPYRPETYRVALQALEEIKRQCPGCVGTVIDTEAYGGAANRNIVLNADPDRVQAAIRSVLDADGPLSAPPAELVYPCGSDSQPYARYAMYAPLGRLGITESSYYTALPVVPRVPRHAHAGRGYFVWSRHAGRYWTPQLLMTHRPWTWEPATDLVMLYGGGHSWLAAAALRNYAAAAAVAAEAEHG